MRIVKDILLALLNATIILLLLLVVAGIILMRQVDHLADQIHDDLTPQAERLERIAEGVEEIEAELADVGDGTDFSALSTQVAALQAELAQATARIDSAGNITAAQIVTALGQVIARISAPLPDAAQTAPAETAPEVQ